MTTDTDTASVPSPAPSGFDNDNRQAATIGDSARDYVNRLRGGDMGSLPAILGLIFLFVVFASLNDRFLTTYNMANLVIQAGSICVMAMGIVFVLLLGEIDLSAGVVSGVCAAVMAKMLTDVGSPWYVAIAAAIITGLLIGLFTGSLVGLVGIPSFVVTLALFLAWQGFTLRLIGEGGTVPVRDPVSVSSLAMTAAQTPLTTPAERSISPSSRMKTRPIARMMIGAAWSARFAMLRGVRNVSGRSAKNSSPRATMPRMAGRAPRSPPRTRST